MLELIKKLLAEAYPEIDQSTAHFERRLLDPLREYFGEGLQSQDPTQLFAARLSAEFPEYRDSVLADAVGRIVGLTTAPVLEEIAALRSRRRLDDERFLTPEDLEESRDVFFVSPDHGRYAEGVFRAYFIQPRTVVIDPAVEIQLQRNGQVLSYHATQSVRVDAPTLRSQREGDRFFVDVPVRAKEPGVKFNLEPGQGRGAVGIPGAALLTNLGAISSGLDADNATRYLARVRTSVVQRTGSTVASLKYLLQEAGYPTAQIAVTGDPLLTRDRLYGPTFLGGILGGYASGLSAERSANIPAGGFVSVGVACDVFIPPQGNRMVRISRLIDEGMVLLCGHQGVFGQSSLVGGVVLGANQHVLTGLQRPFGLWMDDALLVPPPVFRHRWSPAPVESGDTVQVEGWVNPLTGIRSGAKVLSLGQGMLSFGQQTLIQVDPADPWVTIPTRRSKFQVLRRNLDWTASTRGRFSASILPHTSVPAFAVPLRRELLLDAQGQPLRIGDFPALERPGTPAPETRAGAYLPRTRNVIEQDTPLPMVELWRVELMDPLTQQPRARGARTFAYPAQTLACEFLDVRPGNAAELGTLPVRVRVHLMGPQAMSLTPACSLGIAGIADQPEPPVGYTPAGPGTAYTASVAGNPVVGYNSWFRAGPYRPLLWPETTYTASSSDPSLAQTHRLVVSTSGYTTRALTDFAGEEVYDVGGVRRPRIGDWVLMLPQSGAYAFVDAVISDPAAWPNPYPAVPTYDAGSPAWYKICRAYPIIGFEGGQTILISAPDIPVGETGKLWIVQGTSRQVQLSQGRGSEGTYWWDVFCARISVPEDADPNDVEHPPQGTSADYDLREVYQQGFLLSSAVPSVRGTVGEDMTLIFPTSVLGDGEELEGRTIQCYGPDPEALKQAQGLLDKHRPLATSVLARQKPLWRVVGCWYYEADALTTAEAARVLQEAILNPPDPTQLDSSDLAQALRESGATYVSSGRLFVAGYDVHGHWKRAARLGIMTIPEWAQIWPDQIVVRRLSSVRRAQARRLGQTFVEESADNWLEEFVLRGGGFEED